MTTYSEYMTDEGFSKFQEARKLEEECSKLDPEINPYKSRYAACEILQELRSKLRQYDAVHTDEQEPWNIDLNVMLACLSLHLGVNHIETEDTASGEDYLSAALAMVKRHALEPKAVSLLMAVLNQLGILWSGRGEHTKSLDLLLQAENAYKSFKHHVGGTPLGKNELLLREEQRLLDHKRQREFEDTYTHTLYYLAQVYGHLGSEEKSASHCHETLKRQLETSQYEPMDWALNCATLSLFYFSHDYTQARHCLASASSIYAEALARLPEVETEEDQLDDDVDKLKRHKADIARMWVKYCLSLLNHSKDKLSSSSSTTSTSDVHETATGTVVTGEETGNDREHDHNCKQESNDRETDTSLESGSETDHERKSSLRFDCLELTSLESQVTDECVVTFDEARDIFLACQKWISEAKEYYIMDGHVSDYIEIIRDHSSLFKVLSFFEVDLERQCKMHKRRVDMLRAILKELNPQHFLMVCRQLQFELAETYSEMMDLKMALVEISGIPASTQVCNKINTLIKQSLSFFQQFLDSLKSPDGTMPEIFEEDVMRPALIAHFCMARLYSKTITPNPEQRIENLNISLNNYKFVADYVKGHPDTMQKMKVEYELCEEMVALLPVRIARVGSE